MSKPTKAKLEAENERLRTKVYALQQMIDQLRETIYQMRAIEHAAAQRRSYGSPYGEH